MSLSLPAPSPAICRSPAAPTTPLLSKPAVCSSPAGARLAKWNPPGETKGSSHHCTVVHFHQNSPQQISVLL